MSLKNKTLLLTGAMGMLAADLIAKLRGAGANLILSDSRLPAENREAVELLDITSETTVANLVERRRPDWIVNCAAYTAVDLAETEYDLAMRVNALGVGNLAKAAKSLSIPMLHVSTDYVFGAKDRVGREPIAEEVAPSPCGIYGYSKFFGEQALQTILPAQFLLVRTSWLHGINGPNFVDTMLRLGKDKKSLKVVNDQFGSPTYSGWLANTLVKMIERDARGCYHASSNGGVTWFDFAREIFRQAGMTVDVQPQTTTELNRPAPRPPYSVLRVTKLEQLLGESCISWQACVSEHLAARRIVDA